jgi:hypothetical protein
MMVTALGAVCVALLARVLRVDPARVEALRLERERRRARDA